MFELTWTPMSVAEYADYERRVNGQSLCWVGRVWWHRVRPLFYRPLFLHESLDGEAPLPAWASALGGAQYPVPPGTPANSSVHLLVHERSASYSLEDLPPNSRRYARRGLQAFTIEAVPDAETLTRLGHPVYLDFLSRTGYRFNARRRDPERFRAWAEALYRFPKVRILGAFQGSELAAVLICFQVRDVVYYSTQFGNQTALKNNANDLLLHTVKVGVARSPDVRVLFAATAGMPRGLDGFYLQRGFQRRSSPARLRGNPLTLAALRLFFPKACGKLAWSSQQPRAEESSPVAPGPPAQTSGAPKPVRALRLERGAVPPAP